MSYRSLLTGTGVAAILSLGAAVPAQAVVLTNADGVIRNSLCVGFDCPNSPSFSDTTILMMENNTRIKFDDTSTIGSFPRRDWEIEANSNLNGGGEYFGINDCGQSSQGGCATDLVFAIEAGVRQHALYVEADGDIGIGTNNPVGDVHIVTGNTPFLRLEQDGSSGFTPQTWDVAGNETNFFIRDVTNGSTLPLRIQPGAPSNAIFFNANGDATFGSALSGSSGSGNREVRLRSNDGAGQYGELTFVRGSADVFGVGADNNNFYIFGYGVGAGQNVMRINRTTGAVTFDGNVTINGTLTCNPGPC